MVIKVNLPDGSVANFPDGTPPETMKSALQGMYQQKEDKGFLQKTGETITDFTKSTLTGLAELPLNVAALATDVAGATGGETDAPAADDGVNIEGRIAQGLGFLANPIEFVQNPELRKNLLETDTQQLGESMKNSLREVDKIQKEASERSPIASTVGEVGGQIGQLAALPAAGAVRGAKGLAGAGTLLGAGFNALETPRDENLTPEQSLEKRQDQFITGGLGGGALGAGFAGLGKAFKSSPVLLEKASELAKSTPAYITKGFAKLAQINPQAANDFIDPNTTKSLAIVSDSPTIKRLDRFLSTFAGSAGVMRKNTDKTIENIQNRLNNLGAGKAVSIQEAGGIIKKGGENFISKFNTVSTKVFNRLDKKYNLSNEVDVPLTNTIKYLDDYVASKQTTQGILEETRSSGGLSLLEKIVRDAQLRGGTLDYNGLKQYRTLVGQRLSRPANLSGDSFSILKTIYGKLSDDMEQVFRNKGGAALQDFQRANKFYSNGLNNIEKNLNKIINNDAPERVYQAALQGTKLGDFRVRSIMKALKPEEREILRGTVLNRMGLAKAGQQGAEGAEFSIETLLTNWNNLSPEAKISLFGAKNTKTRESLDLIARQAERLRDVNRFTNTSKTAEQVNLGALIIGGMIEPTTAISSAVGANAAARLMTNNNFVNLLGRWATKKPTPNNISRFLDDAQKIVEKNPEIADDLTRYITTIGIIAGGKQ